MKVLGSSAVLQHVVLVLVLVLFLFISESASASASASASSSDDDNVLGVVRSIQKDLRYDENNKLSSHVVLYTEQCLQNDGSGSSSSSSSIVSLPTDWGEDLFEFHPVAAAEVITSTSTTSTTTSTTSTSTTSDDSCQAVCLERGTDRAVAHAAMPHKHYNSKYNNNNNHDNDNDENVSFEKWLEISCRQVEVCWVNYHDPITPIQIFWIGNSNDNKIENGNETPPTTPTLLLEVSYGERNTQCFSSFIGHTFEVRDGTTGASLLQDKGDKDKGNKDKGNKDKGYKDKDNKDKDSKLFVVEFITVKAFGTAPPSDDPDRHENFEKEIESTLHHEWDRHYRIRRTFSELGFAKGRLPDDIFASMGSFYYNNRDHAVLEEWKNRGVFVNWWESKCALIQIPWEMKKKWQHRLKDLVQIWAGVPIEQTDMYGLRQYQSGARLLTHVDRESTHAVSLIVNIAQANLAEPWPVEVHDHADRLHEVILEPGDIVYYESAKCLHGRNRPLQGSAATTTTTGEGGAKSDNAIYVNLFTHYRPVDDPIWFLKPNPEGTPEPVGVVEEPCTLGPAGTAKTASGQLGLVQAVTCPDKRLGPYISPNLFTATSGQDLIDWWRQTAPNAAKHVIPPPPPPPKGKENENEKVDSPVAEAITNKGEL